MRRFNDEKTGLILKIAGVVVTLIGGIIDSVRTEKQIDRCVTKRMDAIEKRKEDKKHEDESADNS